ncbi:MAG TPA: hypothetical protein VI072_20920 [Polyangiaceae bacterium]
MTRAHFAVRPLHGTLAVFCVVSALGASSARADAPTPERWHEELKLGYELKQRGNCVEALPHFLESLRLERQTKTLMHLADCEERLGRLMLARQHWTEARDRAREERSERFSEDAEIRLQAVVERIPQLTIALAAGTTGHAQIECDGAPLERDALGRPLPLDPGAHRISVRAPGRENAYYEVLLNPRESRRLDVEVGRALIPQPIGPDTLRGDASPPRVEPSVRQRSSDRASRAQRATSTSTSTQTLVGWITVGGGLGMAAISGISWAIVKAQYPEVRDCTGPCDSTAGEPRAQVVRAIVGLVAGGLITAGGVTLILTAPSAAPGSAHSARVVTAKPSGSLLSVAAEW